MEEGAEILPASGWRCDASQDQGQKSGVQASAFGFLGCVPLLWACQTWALHTALLTTAPAHNLPLSG